jgi:hypothetical protein
MKESEHPENELEPRVLQIFKAYGISREHELEFVKRSKDRFIATLNMVFDEQILCSSSVGWSAQRRNNLPRLRSIQAVLADLSCWLSSRYHP